MKLPDGIKATRAPERDTTSSIAFDLTRVETVHQSPPNGLVLAEIVISALNLSLRPHEPVTANLGFSIPTIGTPPDPAAARYTAPLCKHGILRGGTADGFPCTGVAHLTTGELVRCSDPFHAPTAHPPPPRRGRR